MSVHSAEPSRRQTRIRHVLITGAASPLGEAVCRAFRKAGIRADGTIRPSGNLPALGLFDELIPLDLTKRGDFSLLKKPYDAVVHVASLSEGRDTDILKCTALSTALLLEKMQQDGIPVFVHVSSMAVHGAINSDLVDAETPIRHTTAFGASKWAAECFVGAHSPQLRGVSVRTPAIVGKRSHRHFLATTLHAMNKRVPMIKLLNPDFLSNNLIHEDTLAEFLVHLAIDPPTTFCAFPVSSSTPMALRDVVERLTHVSGYTGRVSWSKSLIPPFAIAPGRAIQLGFKPLTMAETINRWLSEIDNE